MGTRNIELRGKHIVCKSELGPVQTILDLQSDGRAFYIHEGEDSTTVIQGFTIKNGVVGMFAHGGGINASGASPTIKNNIVYDCFAGRGGGILCENNTAPVILNNTVMYNTNGGLQAIAGTIRNNISRDNDFFNFTIGTDPIPNSYNDFGAGYPGEGNIDLDPDFVDPSLRDFRLQVGSPCIDAGHPDPIYNDPDGTRNDMGAIPTTRTTPMIIHVPADKPTIQAAIDIAIDGDTVLLAPGTYTGAGNSQINFPAKAILLNSELGADSTSLVGANNVIVSFDPGVDTSTIINGLTFTNSGVPLFETSASPRFEHCVFSHVTRNGGMILSNSHSIFSDCKFVDLRNGCAACKDALSGHSGGAVSCGASRIQFMRCEFQENRVETGGGGAAIDAAGASIITIDSSHFHNNYASAGFGGVIAIANSTLAATNSTFDGNVADGGGGVIWADSSVIDADNLHI